MPPRKRLPPNKKPQKRKRVVSKKRENAERRKRRRIREDKAPGRGVTKEDRRAIYLRYGKACLKCGSRKRIVLDHVIALHAGGMHDPCNLQPLCWDCNTEKGWRGCEDYRKRPFSEAIHRSLVRQMMERAQRAKDAARIKRILAQREIARRKRRAS